MRGLARGARRALDHAADHLSLYQLTIEDGTPFAALHAAGTLRIPDGDRRASFYLLTQELCEAAGLPAYEMSNHARPGAESRHNLLYWRGHDYAGIGPARIAASRADGAKRAHVGRSNRRKPGSPRSKRSVTASSSEESPERRRTPPTNIC